jgi:hypothetical protein
MDAADRRVPLRRFREEVREFHGRAFLPMLMGYWQKARRETGARAFRQHASCGSLRARCPRSHKTRFRQACRTTGARASRPLMRTKTRSPAIDHTSGTASSRSFSSPLPLLAKLHDLPRDCSSMFMSLMGPLPSTSLTNKTFATGVRDSLPVPCKD